MKMRAAEVLLRPLSPSEQQDMEIEREARIKKLTFDNAIDISAKDEPFRRKLIDRLKALGTNKRGQGVPLFRKMILIENFSLTRTYLEKQNKPHTDPEVAEQLINSGPYSGTVEALLQQYYRYQKSPKVMAEMAQR